MFKNSVVVESYSTLSAQATVFFGWEREIGVPVAVKQYSKSELPGLNRELVIYTHIENWRKEQALLQSK